MLLIVDVTKDKYYGFREQKQEACQAFDSATLLDHLLNSERLGPFQWTSSYHTHRGITTTRLFCSIGS
jgi:hypothetical protein